LPPRRIAIVGADLRARAELDLLPAIEAADFVFTTFRTGRDAPPGRVDPLRHGVIGQ
jgi:alpha-galactosidase/6-phospho-beta-glucosidase family protein